jgi:hypothetical protein
MHIPVICYGEVKEAVLQLGRVGLEAQEIQLTLQVRYAFKDRRPRHHPAPLTSQAITILGDLRCAGTNFLPVGGII